MSRLKPFGNGGLSHSYGYDLPVLLSHLEGLLDSEVDDVHERRGSKKRMQRIELVEQAIAKLEDAAAMGDEA